DGVAKGYIVDRAGDKLKRAGLKNALINAGGNILAWGNSPAGKPWRIGVQDPWRPGQWLKVIALTDKAVATSGSYERFFDQKHDFHHLLDPKTGWPAGRLVSASVVASTAVLADAMSTAVFVNPGTLKKKNHTEGMTITRNNLQTFTPGFKKLLIG
ncbi:MAG: FAD:protein FMN transferase, partial [Pseudomonadota bacterium]